MLNPYPYHLHVDLAATVRYTDVPNMLGWCQQRVHAPVDVEMWKAIMSQLFYHTDYFSIG